MKNFALQVEKQTEDQLIGTMKRELALVFDWSVNIGKFSRHFTSTYQSVVIIEPSSDIVRQLVVCRAGFSCRLFYWQSKSYCFIHNVPDANSEYPF